jgi:glutamine amidotransferase-like uncharacterized protein
VKDLFKKDSLIFIVLVFWFSCCSAMAQLHNTLYVYSDKGVSAESLTQTLHTLHSLYDKKYSIKTLNADAVMRGKWRKDAALFVMPGGADIPYDKALHGQGNLQINHYVTHGGAYLGLCAGGYYASRQIEFALGTPLEVTGTRELAFFEGIARGPALAPYSYNSNNGARAARLMLSNNQLEQATVFYNGGPQFTANPLQKNLSVLARYQDLPTHPAAIVKIKVGTGTAILSGVHFEYDPALLEKSDAYLSSIIIALEQHQLERMQLLKQIFRELGLQ